MISLARFRAARATDVPSAIVAFALTVAAFAAVFVVSARTLLFQETAPRLDRAMSQETLVYVDRVAVPSDVENAVVRSEVEGPPLPPLKARLNTAPTPAPRLRQPGSADQLTIPSPNAVSGPQPVFLPPYRPQPRSTPSPFDVPRARNPFLSGEQRTRADLDSILAEMNNAVPLLAKTRTPTVAERDSLMRERSSAATVPGRAAQVPGSARGSIGVPIFASGPSAAERRRDSTANAEYVARLRRLQARVNASRESLRVADSTRRHTP